MHTKNSFYSWAPFSHHCIHSNLFIWRQMTLHEQKTIEIYAHKWCKCSMAWNQSTRNKQQKMRNINILPTKNLNLWMLYFTLTETNWARWNEQRRSFFLFLLFLHAFGRRWKLFWRFETAFKTTNYARIFFILGTERGRKLVRSSFSTVFILIFSFIEWQNDHKIKISFNRIRSSNSMVLII